MSKTLAIRGDKARGNEVIALLEMLGGINTDNFRGTDKDDVYFVCEYKDICFIDVDRALTEDDNYVVLTLDEFKEKYPFKVGDKVNIIEYESEVPITKMRWDGNDIEYCVVTCYGDEWFGSYEIKSWNDYEDTETKEKLSDKAKAPVLKGTDYGVTDHVYTVTEGYEFVEVRKDFAGRTEIVLRKKSPVYPKTFEDCVHVLEGENRMSLEQMNTFRKLIDARNAYWKIAGKQMGLGKPWKPNWDSGEPVYCISVSRNIIGKGKWYTDNKILAFPTEEMRDAFYENFKDLIEECKELL